MKALVPIEHIGQKIYLIRGHRVMLDHDLARLYGVTTSRLNEQVKRNKERFPEDFAFRLTKDEMADWMSQFAISNPSVKMGLRKPPYVFTEQGAVAAAFVLNSSIAVGVSIRIIRAFIRLRQMAAAHADLALALTELARKVSSHDERFRAVFSALRRLMESPGKLRRQIGFLP